MRDLRPDGPLVYERLSDPILVRRAKDGDKLALATLCERHAPRVERIALHVLRDPEDARDAAQESLVKLVQRVGQFKGQSQFTTWLHRLVVNTCKDVAQARWRLELGRCLAELPAAQARVVVLQDAFDVPFEEISATTGLPVGTAKCYAHRGRNGLRERLTA